MNEGLNFWLEAWEKGQTPFHKDCVDPDLKAFWHQLNLLPSSKVLVPLCGKSLDLMWLIHQGFKVYGIEVSEEAILQFSKEHQLPLKKDISSNTLIYSTQGLQIIVGDIFKINPEVIAPVDAIYDRAALVALPEKLRQAYVDRCLQWLKPKGKVFLKTLDYNEKEMDGPPFSVTQQDVMALFSRLASKTRLQHRTGRLDKGDPCYGRGLRHASHSLWLMTYGSESLIKDNV